MAPKYGVTTQIPKGWRLAVCEKDDRVFVAVIAQDDPERPGIAACELGLAPENLEDYRTRIDSNARQHGRPSGKLASNRVINDARGERLETVWEFHPDSGGFWHEVTVRIIANRQRSLAADSITRSSTPWKRNGSMPSRRLSARASIVSANFPAPRRGERERRCDDQGDGIASSGWLALATRSALIRSRFWLSCSWNGIRDYSSPRSRC